MASPTTIIMCLLFISSLASAQHLGTISPAYPSGICQNMNCNTTETVEKMKDCVVVVGNLKILLDRKLFNNSYFQNLSFPNLREVTGFVVVYRVVGLDSLSRLLPNLVRIRGMQLINNYALIVYDMQNLREVGLYSLVKIDRGGVIIWGGPNTCYVDTIDWNAIAPRSRHVLSYPEITAHCNTAKPCSCGSDEKNNHCWNSRKCQRFPDLLKNNCHPECLDCRSYYKCTLCRHYTYQSSCVSKCPSHTILLPDSQYCITIEECKAINGFLWNNTCTFECPLNYNKIETNNGDITCEKCLRCPKVCPSLDIDSLSGIQQAERCVFINGSLTIHLRSVPGAVDELYKSLRLVEQVFDYIYIFGSRTITSLDFLPSLRKIGGRRLMDNAYSLLVHDMQNLKKLFPKNVFNNLSVFRGKTKIYNNPKLCVNTINDMRAKFPVPSDEIDIPPGLNGYSGGCDDDHLKLTVKVLNETAATILFNPSNNPAVHYTVLYARVPSKTTEMLMPETCSEAEWFTVHTTNGTALLTSLRPASTYAVCIEIHLLSKNYSQTYLARTSINNFSTPFLKPEPPFIQELVALSSKSVGIHWVDHKDYRQYITSYQLYVTMVEVHAKDLKLRDHCNNPYIFDNVEEEFRHSLVVKPPLEYYTCEPPCFTFHSTWNRNQTEAPIEDHFEVCNALHLDCDDNDHKTLKNSTIGNYHRTLVLDIAAPKTTLTVENLAPFRDYKFLLRACADKKCSRSSKGVIRTLRSKNADIPSIVRVDTNETGNISIKWEPPDVSNGPVLAYLVYIQPVTDSALPYTWCLHHDELNLTVEIPNLKDCKVKVCSLTLGTYNTCSDWKRRWIVSKPHTDYVIILAGFFFSVLLKAASLAIGYFFNSKVKRDDVVPLVDMTSMYRSDSDPPNVMLTDFLPLYSVPLSELY